MTSILPEISILRLVLRAALFLRISFFSVDFYSSPNAEEALSLLSISLPPTKAAIEKAADRFLELGPKEAVVIRSGDMGAYVLTRERPGEWIPAFWGSQDMKEVVDVTGRYNSRFLRAPNNKSPRCG